MSGMVSNLTNPAHREQLEQQMAQVREDPTLKPVLEEIESGGPAAMMKWVTLIVKFIDSFSPFMLQSFADFPSSFLLQKTF